MRTSTGRAGRGCRSSLWLGSVAERPSTGPAGPFSAHCPDILTPGFEVREACLLIRNCAIRFQEVEGTYWVFESLKMRSVMSAQ